MVTVLVRRPRVSALLSEVPGGRLVVVSAPAGTGKTTAVAEWVGSLPGEVRWARGDAAGSDSAWEALVGCLGGRGLSVAGAHGRPGHERLLSLAEAVLRMPAPLTVVLEGFELIEPAVTAQLAFLVRHSGGALRVVLVSRTDPMVPVDHRALGTLVAVRQQALAFTDAEAAELLAALGVALGASSVERLNHLLAGWPVGLHLAGRVLASAGPALSSVESAVRHASGINEYVLNEVLDAQAPDVRRFLLATATLEELTPDAVEQVVDAHAVQILAGLPRLNVYLEPSGGPDCYRYPPFFRDMLRSQLGYESRIFPQARSGLHLPAQRASVAHARGVVRVAARDEPLLIEALTPKEIEVLDHLEELLTTDEIADSMFVTVNTVRTHIRNIMRKLGVTRRYAAVRRARELGFVRVGR